MERKILFSSPDEADYTIEDAYEYYNFHSEINELPKLTLDEYKEKCPEYSSEYLNFLDFQLNEDWRFFKEQLTEELKKTRIKRGFLTGYTSWRNILGMTDLFYIDDVEEVLDKLRIDRGDYRLTVWKKGKRLGFTRYSHDEPTGANIFLLSQKYYKQSRERIFG